MKDIRLIGVRQNNLKNIDVEIPLDKLTVICGPSGSGKSSLAFESLFAEGQRRFIESMSNYTRQFLSAAPKPLIDFVENIPPAICIEQKNSVKNSRSTVGTTTEVVDYLRLLYAKLGQPHCPIHKVPTKGYSVSEASDFIFTTFNEKRVYLLCPLPLKHRALKGGPLKDWIMKQGFARVYLPKEAVQTAEPKTTLKKAKKLKSKKSAAAEVEASTGFFEVSHESSSLSPLAQKVQVGEVVELTDSRFKKGLPERDFYLVVDRLQINSEERGRFADSLAQAYEMSFTLNQNVMGRKACVLTTDGDLMNLSESAACPICFYEPPALSYRAFSFNSPVGACPTCKGFGNILDLDEKKIIPNPKLSLREGAIHPLTMPSARSDFKALMDYVKKKKWNASTPWEALPAEVREAIWQGDDDFFGIRGLFRYLEELKYKMHVRVFISRYRSPFVCPECAGTRLKKAVNQVLFHGVSLAELCQKNILELSSFFSHLTLTPFEEGLAGEVFRQLKLRLEFLLKVGVSYLNLSRETRTLSGGEFQRLVLASQLGMGLSQTLYVLDEPTVGLHPRDNQRLISILKDLRDQGNTLVVVEHDREVIKASDHIIEMGPGSGYLGGEVVYAGSFNEFKNSASSLTRPYLAEQVKSSENPSAGASSLRPERPVDLEKFKYKVVLKGARGHNLKEAEFQFPLNRLVVVTGVSGSGKSTLVAKTLYPALCTELGLECDVAPAEYSSLTGFESLKNVVLIDQSSIGKTARSSPITYLKAYDVIRQIMATKATSPSGEVWGPGDFSLNVDGGRCPVCRGTGYEEIDMVFMDNVRLTCDACDGKRFKPDILDTKFLGKNIDEILNLTVEEALKFFMDYPAIRRPLSFMKEVGLDYLKIGQSASTLSGGESQRLKIAKELSSAGQKSTLYILDEPTTGLHFREVELLMKVLHRLIDLGSSVILIEHNTDVIRSSDYVLDLGPEAGDQGGRLVFAGTPLELRNHPGSLTGAYL